MLVSAVSFLPVYSKDLVISIRPKSHGYLIPTLYQHIFDSYISKVSLSLVLLTLS